MHTPGRAVQRSVEWLNGLPDVEAATELRSCCAAADWLGAVCDERPYTSVAALLGASDRAVAALDDEALGQALAAHPRIGERAAGNAREADWSRGEQAGALGAGVDADVRARLADGNRAYEERFDRVFLIRAAGRTAEEIDDQLRARLAHDDETERAVVLGELADIVRLRLTRLVAG